MTRRPPAKYNWDALEFDARPLPASPARSSARTETIQFVVVHHMTIVGKGTGSALDACIKTWATREASAHYGVDGTMVAQFVWDNLAAWATANHHGNHAGISIEHANSTAGPDWLVADDTWKTGARLVAYLHRTYKLGRPVNKKTLFQHSDFFATSCAGPYMGKTIWPEYVAEAQRVYDEITGAKPVPPVVPPVVPVTNTDASWSDPASFKIGATGPDVLRLGQRLQVWAKALGLPAPYKVAPGSPFTETDRAAVQAFQKAQGWTGADADGFPGAQSLAILATDPPTSVIVTSVSQNMAGNNARGIATAKSRMTAFVAQRKSIPVDVIDAQECTVASTVRPRLDSGLKPLGYIRAGGGKGRYCYTGNRLKVIASGMFTSPKSSWWKLDDKQAAWVVYSVDGALGMDVSMHLESDSGTIPDKLRVTQALYFASAALGIAHQYKVPEQNVLITGDTNSEGDVLAAMVAHGWRNVAAGTDLEDTFTFMGWDGKSRKRFDYGFVRADALAAELVTVTHDTGISDHAGLRIVRQLTK